MLLFNIKQSQIHNILPEIESFLKNACKGWLAFIKLTVIQSFYNCCAHLKIAKSNSCSHKWASIQIWGVCCLPIHPFLSQIKSIILKISGFINTPKIFMNHISKIHIQLLAQNTDKQNIVFCLQSMSNSLKAVIVIMFLTEKKTISSNDNWKYLQKKKTKISGNLIYE